MAAKKSVKDDLANAIADNLNSKFKDNKVAYFLDGSDITPTDIKDLTGLPKKVTQRLHYLPPSPDRWKIRSTTYKGIAKAMASQWG